MLPIVSLSVDEFENTAQRLRMGALGDAKESEVRDIVADVRVRGDEALVDFTERFDDARLSMQSIAVSAEESEQALANVDSEFLEAFREAKTRVLDYHRYQKRKTWLWREEGQLLGQLIRPIERVGIYVPGGQASYPSSVLMTVIPAKVAGVPQIAVCIPPGPDGSVNPKTLAAAHELGVSEIYKIGGAQAVAAMAYGTETISRVDKIVGPGNIYVTLAKKLVFGEVDIDMLAGPSEVLIIADDHADPVFVAADMLGQAEHAPDAVAILVTPSAAVAQAVVDILPRRLAGLSRRDVAAKSLKHRGRIFLVDTLDAAIMLANMIAPEHLELMVEDPERQLPRIKNAGALFLGAFSPEALGDYVAGPSHVLPTGGTARFASSLEVLDFLKAVSVISFSRERLTDVAAAAAQIAEAEGLGAHADSVRVRLEAVPENKGGVES